MKRSRETGDLAFGLLTDILVTTLNTLSVPSIKNTETIPIRWPKLREQAKKASGEEAFLLKWNMMRHLFEQEEMPFDILIGVVGPLFIDLITLRTIQGTVLRLYEPIVLAMIRTGGSDLSFFYNNQRYTIRKYRSFHIEVLVHSYLESERDYIARYYREASLLRRVDDVCRMTLIDSQQYGYGFRAPLRLGVVSL